jgi:hypothetical protein
MRFELLDGGRLIGTFSTVHEAKTAARCLAEGAGDSVRYWVATFNHTHYGVRSRARAEGDRYTVRPVIEPNEPHRCGLEASVDATPERTTRAMLPGE